MIVFWLSSGKTVSVPGQPVTTTIDWFEDVLAHPLRPVIVDDHRGQTLTINPAHIVAVLVS
jgi:hypothetical protein